MADFTLGAMVPYVTQKNFGDPDDPRTEETGCWYASISMIGFYFEAGPRLGVPGQYTINKTTAGGVGYVAPTAMGANYEELVKNENLVPVPHPDPKAWTCEVLVNLLKRRGPMYVRRGWIKNGQLTGGHAIVMVGARTSDNKVIFHDPGSRGANWEATLADFNQFFKWNDSKSKYSLMYKRPPGQVDTEVTRSVAELTQVFGGSVFH
jgi:hypothetical protein